MFDNVSSSKQDAWLTQEQNTEKKWIWKQREIIDNMFSGALVSKLYVGETVTNLFWMSMSHQFRDLKKAIQLDDFIEKMCESF